MIGQLSSQAASSRRLRRNYNLHPTLDDPIQRLLNAFEPGTCVRPHRHTDPARWEVFVALRGRAAVLVHDVLGTVIDRTELSVEGPAAAVEIDAGAWHTLVSLSPGTVLFELKPGPYSPITDKNFAGWAPAEGEPGSQALVTWLETATPGDRPPGQGREHTSRHERPADSGQDA